MSKGEEDRVENELVTLVTELPNTSSMVTGHVRYLATYSATERVWCESAKSVFGGTVDRTLAASGPM